MFVACLALINVYPSYNSCILRPDDLGKDIGLLCFRACLSILPIHPKGGGTGGARVVTSYAGMVPDTRDPSDMTVLHGVTGVDRRW